MTSPRLAQTFDWGRMYARTRGGIPEVPSITTILDVQAQNLEWWEARCSVDAVLDNFERVSAVVREEDGWRSPRYRAMVEWLRDAAQRDRDESSARGDKVHDYADAFGRREMGKSTDADVAEQLAICRDAQLMPYIDQFHRFWDKFQPRPLMTEATVWNSSDAYAGTTDLICIIETDWGPEVTVIDWKTKKRLFKRNGKRKTRDLAIYTGMQLAAAAHAEEVWIEGATPAEDKWVPWEYEVGMGAAVAIAPDGYVVRQYDIDNPLVWTTFRALRAAWDYSREGAATRGPIIQDRSGFVRTPSMQQAKSTASV